MVEPKKAIVDADVKLAEEAAAASNAIKTECEDALSEAIPILEAAISALDTIKPADIKLVQVGGGGGAGLLPNTDFHHCACDVLNSVASYPPVPVPHLNRASRTPRGPSRWSWRRCVCCWMLNLPGMTSLPLRPAMGWGWGVLDFIIFNTR